jgi:hypothetical protein
MDGHAAEDQSPEPSPPVGGHRDQVDAELIRSPEDRLGGRAFWAL